MANSDRRVITVADVGFKPSVSKQPDDIFDYTLDFTNWLTDGALLDGGFTPTVDIEGMGTTAPTAGAATVTADNKKVKVRISGGSGGWGGVVTILAKVDTGEEKEVEFELLIREIAFTSSS